MKIEVVPFCELSSELRQRWAELCEGCSAPLNSPFYRPEFAEIIDQVRGDVEVAVVEDSGRLASLLPFHRLRGNLGRPVGLHLNDFQGFIGRLPDGVQPADVIRACRLQAWDFDHVPVVQAGFAASTALIDASPFVDLSDGIDAYERFRNEKSHDLRDSARRLRKLAREHGELRFEHDTRNPQVLNQLVTWKRQQFERTSVPDVLAEAWVREVVALMASRTGNSFAGLASGLWAGDRLIAAEFSPRSRSVYHLQWCAYDSDFHPYSPGRLLNESLMRWAPANGISRIEFGKGDQDYKLRAATGQHLVATGSVVSSAFQRVVRGTWWSVRRWARSSSLRPHLKAAAGYYYRLRRATPKLALREQV